MKAIREQIRLMAAILGLYGKSHALTKEVGASEVAKAAQTPDSSKRHRQLKQQTAHYAGRSTAAPYSVYSRAGVGRKMGHVNTVANSGEI